jgi:hypothetical protein
MILLEPDDALDAPLDPALPDVPALHLIQKNHSTQF